MNRLRVSIAAKLSLTLGFIMILSFGGLIASNLFNLYNNSLTQGELEAQQQSELYADSLHLEFIETLSMLKTIRSIMLEMIDQGTQNRALIVGTLQNLLIEHPNILGLYTMWEPNAFDQRDDENMNKNSYDDESGRFVPYVVRNKGLFHVLPIDYNNQSENMDYYTIPKMNKRLSLIEPSAYEINGDDILMTTLALPILDNWNQFLGVVGADITVDFVQKEIEAIHPLGGYLTVITATGSYLANGRYPELIGKPYEDFSHSRDILSKLDENQRQIYTPSQDSKGEDFRLFYPVLLDKEMWHIEIVIPKKNILASYYEQLRTSLFISVVAFLFTVVMMVILLDHFIIRRIHEVIRASQAVADGDLDRKLTIGTEDEVGLMAHHFNQMVSSRKEAERRIQHQATHDLLTGLANRSGFMEYMNNDIIQLKSKIHSLSLLFIDLDRFKYINDSMDHSVGDILLQHVAERLLLCVASRGEVFRLGGDEFVIVFTALPNQESTLLLTEQILQAISEPITLGDKQIFTTASIGISFYSALQDNLEALVKEADTAMYVAKKVSNTYIVYNPSMSLAPSKEITMEREMQTALENNEFTLYYQPKVDLATRTIYGVEALIRWDHPELGIIPPSEFIPIAERTGFIISLGEWVLDTACQQNKAWQDMGLPPIQVGVNLSMVQFQNRSLLQMVKNCVTRSGIDPCYLDLELTETVLMNNPVYTIKTLHALRDFGVLLSLDDFGTGYSSLSYLKNFPLHTVKLDKSFIQNISKDIKEQLIVNSVIVIAHSLNLKVITEGVETVEQLRILESNRCDSIQGFYFDPPMTSAIFTEMYKESRIYK